MENSIAVANAFIKIAKDHGRPLVLTKLLKLLYFAHGWHLALFDEPLLEEEFQAWQFGPVIPSVYSAFKDSSMKVKEQPVPYFFDGKTSWIYPSITPSKEDLVIELLNKIWEVYGSFTAHQLSDMTHEPDTPWTRIRNRKPKTPRDAVIPNDLIQAYFKKKEASNG